MVFFPAPPPPDNGAPRAFFEPPFGDDATADILTVGRLLRTNENVQESTDQRGRKERNERKRAAKKVINLSNKHKQTQIVYVSMYMYLS